MAGAVPRRERIPSIITPDYIELLQGLCVVSHPTKRDVAAVFDEFRRTLGGGGRAQPSTSRGGSGRGDPSAAFDRPCTKSATASVTEAPCWLLGELEAWNRILARNCVELREHCPGCLTLQGFAWPESNAPDIPDALRATLLVHVLLRQHRCVTRVFMDESQTTLETDVFWHAVRTGCSGILYFEYNAYRVAPLGQPEEPGWAGASLWAHGTASLRALESLHVAHAKLEVDAALALAEFMTNTTTLKAFAFYDVKTTEEVAAYLLTAMARNKTITSFWAEDILVSAGGGTAIAEFVRNHPTLEVLQVSCSGLGASPSALLRAAVQSKSLKILAVHECCPDAEDLEVMAAALTRHPPPYEEQAGEGAAAAALASPEPTSTLENLSFFGDSRPASIRKQRAYAWLIGGVLKTLKLPACGLGDVFAAAATRQLRIDTTMENLSVQTNTFTIAALCAMIGVLSEKENSTLESLFVDVRGARSPFESEFLYMAINSIENKSRLVVNWVNPIAQDFSEGSAGACLTTAIHLDLDGPFREPALEVLDVLASGGKAIDLATIDSFSPPTQALVQKLADSLSRTTSLRDLNLRLAWPEAALVSVLRGLENNRSIWVLQLARMTFKKRAAKALGKLIEQNHKLNMITVNLEESAYLGFDGWAQLRALSRELKESVPRNRLLTSVNVLLGGENRVNDFAVKDTLRRNQALVNSAVRFVGGSVAKKDALAFETVRNCQSLTDTLSKYGLDKGTPVVEVVKEARERLACDYFIFTGVVKARLECYPDPRGKTRLDKLDKKCMVRLGSFLSLTDVMDI
ncbi:uncharacterized protein LOC144158754 [Haemaphysalis longicornis]